MDVTGPEAPLIGAQATTGASVVRGGLWKIASNALPQIYTLVISIAAARYLGPDGMGRQSFIAFVELATILLLSSGFSVAVMRYVGEAVGAGRPDAARWLAGAILRVELLAAALGALVLISVGLAGAEPQGAWFLAGIAAAGSIPAAVPGAVLTGLQRWRQATIAGLVTGGLGTVATVFVLELGGGITGMFAVEAAAALIAFVWTAMLARGALFRITHGSTRAPDLRRGALRFSLYSTAGTVLYLIVWRRSEFFFLNHYSSDAEIAYYSIAFGLVVALVRLPSAMGEVLAPAVATLFGAGAHERIRSGFSRALRLLLLATMPIAAASAALGPETIRVIWGSEFGPAEKPFLIMVFASLMTPVTVLSASLLAGLGKVRVPLVADAAAAVVDIGLAFALVPRHGAVGAAIANSAAQLASGVPLLVYGSRLAGPVRWEVKSLARTAVLSAAGGAAAWGVVTALGGPAGIVLGLVAGAFVFFVLAALVRILPADDAAWLGDALGARGRRLPQRAALRLGERRA